MVQSDVAQAVMPQLLTVRQPLGLSVFLMGATPEQAAELRCDGAVVRDLLQLLIIIDNAVLHESYRH